MSIRKCKYEYNNSGDLGIYRPTLWYCSMMLNYIVSCDQNNKCIIYYSILVTYHLWIILITYFFFHYFEYVY